MGPAGIGRQNPWPMKLKSVNTFQEAPLRR